MADCKVCKNRQKQGGGLMWCKAYSNVISNSKRGGSDEPCDEFSRVEETIIEEAISTSEPMSVKQDIVKVAKTDMSDKVDIVNNKMSVKQDIVNKPIKPMSDKVDTPDIVKKVMSLKADIPMSDKADIPIKILEATLTTKEIANIFNVNDKTIHRWLKSNKFKSNKLVDVIDAYNSMGGGITE